MFSGSIGSDQATWPSCCIVNTVKDLEKIDNLRNPDAEAAHARLMQEILNAPKAGPMPPEPPPAPVSETRHFSGSLPISPEGWGSVNKPIPFADGRPLISHDVLASLVRIKLEQLEKEHAYYLQLYRQLTG